MLSRCTKTVSRRRSSIFFPYLRRTISCSCLTEAEARRTSGCLCKGLLRDLSRTCAHRTEWRLQLLIIRWTCNCHGPAIAQRRSSSFHNSFALTESEELIFTIPLTKPFAANLEKQAADALLWF